MRLAIRWRPNAEADVDKQAGYYFESATLAVFDRFRVAELESLKLHSRGRYFRRFLPPDVPLPCDFACFAFRSFLALIPGL